MNVKEAVWQLRSIFLPKKYASKSAENWAHSTHYKGELFYKTQLRRDRKRMWTLLADKTDEGIPCIVVACDEGDYVVQVLSVPGKAGSFVEATVRQADALFPFFHEKVGMLNLAGPNEAIEDLGENFGKGHYNVYINSEQHSLICQPKAKE
jgi:hypothetical protein